MAPKTIVITGASGGIGAAAARQLAGDGHQVVVVGRSPERTAAVADDTGGQYILADFADLNSVRNLASEILQRFPRINVLANNAGAMFGKERQVTVDGHEKTLQVNYLAPFLLTRLLTDRLLESRGTVINTSSSANLFARVDLEDLEQEKGYKPFRAYAATKLEQILFTGEFDRRYRSHGATSTAFHPGLVGSAFLSTQSPLIRAAYRSPVRRLARTPEAGARTLVYLAEGTPGEDYPTGKYFRRNKVARPNRQTGDGVLALGLWNRSAAMLEGAA
ncbi:SDR family NAD(P)-dependent oxidoreductase [Arthrobacter sp. zg-Y820]|uniref:SDR family NAD(P)-dependent oxidoreductase n=1 Tax=unclassified Arthrobacter TaxID=235627 RepID=UPI002540E423|nr:MULTISPECIES: SDR family NAD(P)-dependent oxidoreductase [unclassified Arthrobacter]MCC9197598.1 SDR family NAD(P)-dependent oxidoreductase [Arthrobacter sp. zg-Y820]MDK1280465.1 SDR family NAD(P)-dependent oxidoreductase [Arthrobacter sp. zg.Y820]MDK1361981.1 SDR family NAD(P)-dependent oxidoreductase [Arthrobacter sp. zg-Y1219]WIB10893.1 SDR family NAD(P)-dependent oxidoreductase [Arthrobacter sp. zg-Y820]